MSRNGKLIGFCHALPKPESRDPIRRSKQTVFIWNEAMRKYLCGPLRGKRYGKLQRIRTWTIKYRRAKNRTKLLKLNGCLTKRTCYLARLSNEKISHNSIIGNEKKSNWQWTNAYTAAITFNFFSHLQHYVCPSVRKFNLLGTTFS